MSISKEINAALETRLSTLTGTHDFAWPNISYEPQPTSTFLRPTNLPIGPLPIGIGDSDLLRRDGLFQVDVFTPKNKGSNAALEKADAIIQHFYKGLELTTATNGYVLKVKDAGVDVGETVGAHYAVPVLIYYSVISD